MLRWNKLLQKIYQSRVQCIWYKNYGLSIDNINPYMKNIEYAVLGPLVQRAAEMKKSIDNGTSTKNFKEVILCTAGDNLGNGQAPVTFLRQVLALSAFPHLFNDSSIPDDAKQKAQRILDNCEGKTIGAYGYQTGIDIIREDIVKYIEERDNLPVDVNNVFVTTGASEGIDYMMHLVSTGKCGNERAGVMLPMPIYPLYLGFNSKYDNFVIKYFLDEANNWNLNISELERAYNSGLENSVPKLLVALNPGNPTGNLLSRNDIETVIRFAKKKGLTIIADEVYQKNIYGCHEFLSFKRVLHDMGPECNDVEMVSLMSASKGVFGECGIRGGYMELLNMQAEVKERLLTNLSLRTCAPILGQVGLDVVINPPKRGEASFELFEQERSNIHNGLQSKAQFVTEKLNEIPGYSCNEVAAALYAFPKVDMPENIIQAAKESGLAPDSLYCRLLLENYGVCVLPGSSFIQAPGTHHVRLTLSPPLENLGKAIEALKRFHNELVGGRFLK